MWEKRSFGERFVKNMKLKKWERTEYEKNTLFEVIFQSRFPKILKDFDEKSASFGEKIRNKGFPENKVKKVTAPPGFPEQLQKELLGDDEYMFFSENGEWQITLTKDFIALKCAEYKNYAEFEVHLKNMLEVFWKEFSPNYFGRIGLRYRNLVNAQTLESKKDIRQYIPPHIAPELGKKSLIRNELQVIEKTLQLKDDISTVSVRYVYGDLSGKFGKFNLNQEKSYIIDIDSFTTDKTRKVTDAIATSKSFNEGNIRNIFQWSITDALRKTMGPISA